MIDPAARAALEAAYRSADYCVRLPLGNLLLKVDKYRKADDRRLRDEAGVESHWAIVTPCNPESRRLSSEENRRRLDEFKENLRPLGMRYVVSVNRDPQGQWPEEAGFLLCDPRPGVAEELGRHFQQNAILVGRLGEAPQLQWLND